MPDACPTLARLSSIGSTKPVSARVEHLLAAASPQMQILPSCPSRPRVAEPLLDVCVVVSDAPAVRRVMLPVVPSEGIDPWPVHVDVAAIPIDTPAPVVSARRPVAEKIPGAEGNASTN